MSDWTSVEPALDFLMLGQVMNIVPRLYATAHKRLTPKVVAGEDLGGGAGSETFLLDVSWHKVAGLRYQRGLMTVSDPWEQKLQRLLCIVLEPLRWLHSWFTQSAHGLQPSKALPASRISFYSSCPSHAS